MYLLMLIRLCVCAEVEVEVIIYRILKLVCLNMEKAKLSCNNFILLKRKNQFHREVDKINMRLSSVLNFERLLWLSFIYGFGFDLSFFTMDDYC